MRYWPQNLSSYGFNGREVEQITGVPRATQRQWLVRYLDFRQQQFIHHGSVESGTWSWEGVQMLALFSQVLKDLRDAAVAQQVLMLESRHGTVRDPLGIFHSDQRGEDGGGDLLIVGDLADLSRLGFGTCGAGDLASFADGTMRRLYMVNFSALQRVLFARAAAAVDLESGPGALSPEMRA